MDPDAPICDLDDTWEDMAEEYSSTLRTSPTWKCYCIDSVEKEEILSAPEVMDPQTDTGFGYRDIYSLRHQLACGEIPPPSSFTDDESLIELMDYLHIRELQYLKGYSLIQSYLAFPYFLNLDLLKHDNPVMYAYCRALMRTLESVLRVAFATSIRGDEEFMAAPQELDQYMSLNLKDILSDLETAASSASPAVAIRLRWRRNFLMALVFFQEATSRIQIDMACDLCTTGCEWLAKAPEYQRKEEPKVDGRLMREKEVQYWVSVITPSVKLPEMPFRDAMKEYQRLLEQLASLRALLDLRSLNEIREFVEELGAQAPLLLLRCIAVVTLFSRDPNESFLFGPPLPLRLLETLSKVYGAPLYLRVFQGNSSLIDSIVKYRIQKTMNPVKVTPQQVSMLRQQTLEAVGRWTSDACKHYLIHLENMLCNRGLAHRRLMNAIPAIADFQQTSYSTDLNIFLFRYTGGTERLEQEGLRRNKVLTLWANTHLLHTMELIVKFQIELNLLKPGEMIPAMWYLSTAHKAQMENILQLCIQNPAMIPDARVNKKGVPLYNVALSSRTSGSLDYTEATIMEVERLLADAQLYTACIAEQKKLIEFRSVGSDPLITAENIFNHRYLKCFGSIQSPAFASFAHCMATKPVIADEEVPVVSRRASALAITAAEKVKALLASQKTPMWASRRRTLLSMMYAARNLAACLTLLGDAKTNASAYVCSQGSPEGLPHGVRFLLRANQQQQQQ